MDKKAGSNEKGKKGKQVNDTSPLRRSILEANETEADSSAAEDLSDDKHAKSTKAATKPTHPPITDFGEIQVAVNFDTNRNKLIVRVIQAQGLINTDKDSLSDPYARIILVPDKKKRTKRKTKIIKDSLHPNWDETFEFEVASLAEARTKSLDVVVKNDKSLFSREKTFMGECLISLESMFDLELGNVNWYRLQDQSLFESVLKKLQD